MNNLVIDAGNTRIKYGIFNQNDLIHVESTGLFSEEYVIKLIEKFSINQIIISSVININNNSLLAVSKTTNLIWFDETTPIPIKNNYKTPKTLGKDRLANAIGANFLFPNQKMLVIDAGTCIKFDFVNDKAEYMGGSIAPGLNMRLEALNKFTDKLPLIKLNDINYLVGQTTEESILSGVINGAIAEIDGLIDTYKQKFEIEKIILTGGDYIFLEKRLKNQIFALPNLGLIGLNNVLTYSIGNDSFE